MHAGVGRVQLEEAMHTEAVGRMWLEEVCTQEWEECSFRCAHRSGGKNVVVGVNIGVKRK